MKTKNQLDMFGDLEPRGKMTAEELNYYNSYQRAVVYTPRTFKPPYVLELCNTTRYEMLLRKIDRADIEDAQVKRFLKHAAARFIDFDFSRIADFYACTDKPTQELFEELGLVIIDINKAIEKGFVELDKHIMNSMFDEKDNQNQDDDDDTDE